MAPRLTASPTVPRPLRPQIAAGILSLHFLLAALAAAQRLHTSFGPVTDTPVRGDVAGVAVSRTQAGAVPVVLVLTQNPPAAHLFVADERGGLAERTAAPLPRAYRRACAAGSEEQRPAFFLHAPRDGSVALLRFDGDNAELLQLPEGVEGELVRAADINNDGRTDLLGFGRSTAGVGTLIAKGKDSFVRGPVLFPDVSVSDLAAADLNGDRIIDVVAADWLGNSLGVFYGIGRGVFSEQARLPLRGEPRAVALWPATPKRTHVIAVSLPDSGSVAVMRGNPTGEFVLSQTLLLGGRPEELLIVDVNSDGLPDLVAPTGAGIAVAMGRDPGVFRPPALFSPAARGGCVALGDLDGDGLTDMAAADPGGGRVVVIRNARSAAAQGGGGRYAVGLRPRGVAVGDWNGDGRTDVAVANSGSATLSVLYAGRDGGLDGQEALAVAPDPQFIRVPIPSSAPGRRLIITHGRHERCSIVSVAEGLSTAGVASISTGASPFVLAAREDTITGRLRMLVRSVDRRSGRIISLFDELDGGRFLERSYRASIPDRVVALTLDEFTRPGALDLVALEYDAKRKTSRLTLSAGGERAVVAEPRTIMTIPDTAGSARSVLAARVTADSLPDVAAFFGPPRNAMVLLAGSGAGEFRDPPRWVGGVNPANDDAVIFRDADGDGLCDVTLVDRSRNGVVTLYGTAEGDFTEPAVVWSGKRATGLRLAPAADAGRHDLVIVSEEDGWVSVVRDPFRRRP